MNSKIISLSAVILLCFCLLGVVFADNITDNDTDEEETLDLSMYILPVGIDGDEVLFSDEFTGFSLDLSDDDLTSDTLFNVSDTSGLSDANYLKLAVVECYKANREDDIDDVISAFLDGSYEKSNDDVVKAVMNSNETVNDHVDVEINNTTDGSFDFEVLESEDSNVSNYFAYKVSLTSYEVLGTDDNDTEIVLVDNETDNDVADNETADNSTDSNNSTDNKTNKSNTTKVIETNNTIINRTNTVTINENNTTIINHNTVNHINNTTNQTPKNDSNGINMQNTGYPILLIVIVIILIAAAVVLKRRD